MRSSTYKRYHSFLGNARRAIPVPRPPPCHDPPTAHLSRLNSQRGSSGRSYSGMGSSWAELRRVVMRTSGVLEFMEELESADTCRREAGETQADHRSQGPRTHQSPARLEELGCVGVWRWTAAYKGRRRTLARQHCLMIFLSYFCRQIFYHFITFSLSGAKAWTHAE